MKILVVVDVQNDFTTGILGTPEAQAAIPAIKEKVAAYAADPNATIFFTQDTHGYDYANTAEGANLPFAHCIRGTEGWRIVKDILPEAYACAHYNINKPTFGYIDWAGELDAFPEEIESIEVIGFCTEICVVSNALILQAVARTMFENEPTVSCDAACCAGVTRAKHLCALEVMKSCQIEVINE